MLKTSVEIVGSLLVFCLMSLNIVVGLLFAGLWTASVLLGMYWIVSTVFL